MVHQKQNYQGWLSVGRGNVVASCPTPSSCNSSTLSSCNNIEEDRRCRSYGNYNPCPTCGFENLSHTWNSLDTCVPPLVSCCSSSSSSQSSNCIPSCRCDFQERASRNIFEWKSAFDYGTTYDAMDYGNQGAGCVYMGSLSSKVKEPPSMEDDCSAPPPGSFAPLCYPFPWYPKT